MKAQLITLTLITSAHAEVAIVIDDKIENVDKKIWRFGPNLENPKVFPKEGKAFLYTFRIEQINQEKKVIKQTSYFTVSTSNLSTVKKVMAVNTDFFREVPDNQAKWCIYYEGHRFFAKGTPIALLARGDVGSIQIGKAWEKAPSINYSFKVEEKDLKELEKRFKIDASMIKMFKDEGGFKMDFHQTSR